MERILTLKEEISKFFEKHLDFLTSVPQQRIQKIILSKLYKGEQREIAKRPTEGTGWHYSHPEGNVVHGYQVHVTCLPPM